MYVQVFSHISPDPYYAEKAALRMCSILLEVPARVYLRSLATGTILTMLTIE